MDPLNDPFCYNVSYNDRLGDPVFTQSLTAASLTEARNRAKEMAGGMRFHVVKSSMNHFPERRRPELIPVDEL